MTNVDLVRLAGSRGRLSESHAVDPVTAEVIRGGLQSLPKGQFEAAHGGTLSIESKVGEGTQVRVALPAGASVSTPSV